LKAARANKQAVEANMKKVAGEGMAAIEFVVTQGYKAKTQRRV
jgi:hypothetical protein